MPTQGQSSPSVVIAGAPVTCISGGNPVVWIANYQLNEVGVTLRDFQAYCLQSKSHVTGPPPISLFWLVMSVATHLTKATMSS
jgi:hypothetical protein